MQRRHPRRLGATIGIAGIAALAIPSVAMGTEVAMTGDCILRDGRQALVVNFNARGWPAGSTLEGAAARDGVEFVSGSRSATAPPPGATYSLPEGLEGVSFLPAPQASVHATGHLAAYLPGDTAPYRVARLDEVLICPAAPQPQVVITPQPQRPALEPLPLVTNPRKTTKPQKPRPRRHRIALIRCSSRWQAKPKGFATFRGDDSWWHPYYGNRGRVNCGREPLVAGEHLRAQGPAPGTIVSRLLSQVPALAEDVPGPVSSISVAAGGKSANGTMDAAEKGRLVPAPIPGHPWTSKSTSPRRGVAVSVSWRSGRVTVSVLYSASRGRSTTSVSAR